MNTALQYGASKSWGKVVCAAILAFGLITSDAQAEDITVVAMGDSLTQGYGLPQGEGFVPQLETWLSAQGSDVRMINAGVSGDTTAGGLARAAWTLTEDVDAMIVALGGNDMLRGVDPANSKSNLAGILEAAAAQDVPVLLVGMQAPGNYGPDYKEAFDTMYPDLAAQFDTLYAPSFLAGLGTLDPAEAQNVLQADGLHPNKRGVALIVEALGPHVLALIDAAQP